MLIKAEWQLFDDGVIRPIARIRVLDADSFPITDDFLIDTGADRTVFNATLAASLNLAVRTPQTGYALGGIGGASNFGLVATALEFPREGGGFATVRGEFAVFTNESPADLNILGRDVLDHFDLIFSRRRDEILFLSQRHRYLIELT